MREYKLAAIIKKIEVLGGKYDPNSYFSVSGQLAICEAIAEATPIQEKTPSFSTTINEERPVLNGKTLLVNEKALDAVLEKLKKCNAKTPPKEIETLLIRLFGSGLTPSQWLRIVQNYYPRQIYWELKHLKKRLRDEKLGWLPIRNPPAYFTHRIRFRKKRRRKYK